MLSVFLCCFWWHHFIASLICPFMAKFSNAQLVGISKSCMGSARVISPYSSSVLPVAHECCLTPTFLLGAHTTKVKQTVSKTFNFSVSFNIILFTKCSWIARFNVTCIIVGVIVRIWCFLAWCSISFCVLGTLVRALYSVSVICILVCCLESPVIPWLAHQIDIKGVPAVIFVSTQVRYCLVVWVKTKLIYIVTNVIPLKSTHFMALNVAGQLLLRHLLK